MLKNDVNVRMNAIYDTVLMVKIYEKDMSFIIERYYSHMI